MKKQSILVSVTIVLLFGSAPISFAAVASFQGLGDLVGGEFRSCGNSVSADGSIVVGYSRIDSGNEAFRWTESEGMIGLGDLYGEGFSSVADDASNDGSVIVGSSGVSGPYPDREAFRWTESTGMIGLGDLPGGEVASWAEAISGDGTTIVGKSYSSNGKEAFRWTQASGMVGLGDLAGGVFSSEAMDVSSDGSIIVGRGYSAVDSEAFRWTELGGMVGLGSLPGAEPDGGAKAVSSDGSVVVGYSKTTLGAWEAFRWTQETGMVGLGDLPGGSFDSWAWDVSGDGSIVVGSGITDSPIGNEAFIWTESRGMMNLKGVLENDFGLDLTGWTLYVAYGISEDGTAIVGWGDNPEGYYEAWIARIPEPAAPPVADAGGTYTIYVCDTLTLDANGSTDDDNDIVSYMWDLDDNGSFETDAGSQAIFDVNYTYLLSLGLLVDNTYNIHLKVTDSEAQSDTADSTLTIIPQPALQVAVDIKPGSCPNPLNVKSSGVLPVAILGSNELDVNEIVETSIQLAGVDAIRHSFEDVAAPAADTNDCNCTEAGPDGYLDLTLKFKTQEIVDTIGDVNDGDVLALELTGVLFGERPIEGADCVLIRGKHKPLNKADFNGDGKVDMADFAAFAENWLQSSIVED